MSRIEAMLRLLNEMKERNADALHLSAGTAPVFTVRGVPVPLPEGETQGDDELRRLVKEMVPPSALFEFERDHDATFVCSPDGATRLRGVLQEHQDGIGLCLRLVPERPPSLAEIGAPPALAGLRDARGGIVLVAGPAGAGKSTTLSALFDAINETHARHLLMLSAEPAPTPKSKRSIVVRRQVGTDALSLAAALRAAPRQDVDVVLVDPLPALGHPLPVAEPAAEVVPTLLCAAEAGLLCLVALRAGSTFHAIESLVAALAPSEAQRTQQTHRQRLGRALRAVVFQRLCRAADEKGVVPAYEVLLGGAGLPAALEAGTAPAIEAYLAAGRPSREGQRPLFEGPFSDR